MRDTMKVAVLLFGLATVAYGQDDILQQLRRAGYDVVVEGDGRTRSSPLSFQQGSYQQQPETYTLRLNQEPVRVQQRNINLRVNQEPVRVQQRNINLRVNQDTVNTKVVEQYPQRGYEYGYQLDDTQGSHGHIEKRDDSGRVEGEYTINLGDGRVRVVKYVADENGYRADVSTDELGTESKNPNDVYIGSTAISGFDAALKYGPFAPPHYEAPLEPAARPEAPRVAKTQAVDTRINLPTYGTFAAHG